MGILHNLQQLPERFFGRAAATSPAAQRSGAEAILPEKIFIDREGGEPVYSFDETIMRHRVAELLDGYYSNQNYLTLFYSLPEIFAPIHEIASRVADAQWEFVKDFGDNQVDYANDIFNRLFEKPNPFESMKEMVYKAVVYELCTGRNLWYANAPAFFQFSYDRVLSWFNLDPLTIPVLKQGIDIYSTTDVTDIIQRYELRNAAGVKREFEADRVFGAFHTDPKFPYDLRYTKAPLSGAAAAIRNLIPVYEARGMIYIKRGALGFIVNKGKDANGPFILTEEQKKEIMEGHRATYGVTRGKAPVAWTSADIDFVRTAMSIQELQPFEETYADALAIYSSLRVPKHLAPSLKQSTFNNADADMRSFYQDIIVPMANKYAQIWTSGFHLKDIRRYIRANYSHINYLQENAKEKSDVDKTNGLVWLQRWQNGVCTLNEWIIANDGTKGVGPIYDKKVFELTAEELATVAAVIKALKGAPNVTDNSSQDTGSQTQSGGNQLQVA